MTARAGFPSRSSDDIERSASARWLSKANSILPPFVPDFVSIPLTLRNTANTVTTDTYWRASLRTWVPAPDSCDF